MTPQQLNALERQLQINHVDIQRLWKRVPQFPHNYPGMPIAVPAGGLSSDTTPTTASTTTPTTGTTQTLPPGPCADYYRGTYEVEIPPWSAGRNCGFDAGCSSIPTGTFGMPASGIVGGVEIGRDACEPSAPYLLFGGVGDVGLFMAPWGRCDVLLHIDYDGGISGRRQCYATTYDSWDVGSSKLLGRYGGGGDVFDSCYGREFSDDAEPCIPPPAVIVTRLT